MDTVNQGFTSLQYRFPGGAVRRIIGQFLPGIPEFIHIAPDRHIPYLKVGLFHQAYILVPGAPEALPSGLGNDAPVQQLIPKPLYPFNNGSLAYLTGGFLTVKAGKIDGFKGGHFHPLPGVSLGRSVGKIMAGDVDRLLVSHNSPLSYFYTLKG
jgi:hypothetical protein